MVDTWGTQSGCHPFADTFEKLKENDDPYINFGEMARSRLGQQCQYASRYLTDDFVELGYPHLGEGLRYQGSQNDYHFLKIHKDDVEEFIQRWEKHTGCQRLR